ncbi:MAG: serine hydrolase [Candidatus Neomarinimicrobiota bacterium]
MKRLSCSIAMLAAGLFFCACLPDENLKLPFTSYVPDELEDNWPISSPESEGMDAQAIQDVYARFFSEDEFPLAHSLLIVRNGRLVAEAYCRDERDQEWFHHLQSATKCITSLLLGIAIDQGHIDSVNTKVYDIIPEYFDSDLRKRAITLYHVLTMRTGLHWSEEGIKTAGTPALYHYSKNSLSYVLCNNLDYQPGTHYFYSDGDPQLISGVIQKVTGLTLDAFADRYLFNPLGITDYQWERHRDGVAFGAFGLWLKPRDMAKIGKMVEQGGVWNDQQIVSAEWLSESTQLHVPDRSYGYYWRVRERTDPFYATGHGGQYIHITPLEDLVIVVTSDPNGELGGFGEFSGDWGTIFAEIRDAIY